jgi:hypothetical protein
MPPADQQVTLKYYMDASLWVSVLFLLFVPIGLVFIKKAKNKVGVAEAVH